MWVFVFFFSACVCYGPSDTFDFTAVAATQRVSESQKKRDWREWGEGGRESRDEAVALSPSFKEDMPRYFQKLTQFPEALRESFWHALVKIPWGYSQSSLILHVFTALSKVAHLGGEVRPWTPVCPFFSFLSWNWCCSFVLSTSENYYSLGLWNWSIYLLISFLFLWFCGFYGCYWQ